jgi:DNA-binding MarR family transcriptional regulator
VKELIELAPVPARRAGEGPVPLAAELADVLPRLRRALRSAVRRRVAAPALPAAQVELLLAVDAQPDIRVGDVAASLLLAPNTVSTLVGGLARAGLLERRPDPADGRGARLRVSAAGTARIRRWRHAREAALLEAVALLDAADAEGLAAAVPALGRLADGLEVLGGD